MLVRKGQFACVAFRPNGEYVVAGSTDRSLWLWNAASGEEVNQFSGVHQHTVRAVAFSPDGTRLVSGDEAGALRIWDVASAEPLMLISQEEGPIWGVAFSPDGRTIASAGNDGAVKLWETVVPSNAVLYERSRVGIARRLVDSLCQKLFLAKEVAN